MLLSTAKTERAYALALRWVTGVVCVALALAVGAVLAWPSIDRRLVRERYLMGAHARATPEELGPADRGEFERWTASMRDAHDDASETLRATLLHPTRFGPTHPLLADEGCFVAPVLGAGSAAVVCAAALEGAAARALRPDGCPSDVAADDARCLCGSALGVARHLLVRERGPCRFETMIRPEIDEGRDVLAYATARGKKARVPLDPALARCVADCLRDAE